MTVGMTIIHTGLTIRAAPMRAAIMVPSITAFSDGRGRPSIAPKVFWSSNVIIGRSVTLKETDEENAICSSFEGTNKSIVLNRLISFDRKGVTN